jgi:hypothetical protein
MRLESSKYVFSIKSDDFDPATAKIETGATDAIDATW